MAITRVAGHEYVPYNTMDPYVRWPWEKLHVGDVVIVYLFFSSSVYVSTVPTGWTLVDSSASNNVVYVYRKTLTQADVDAISPGARFTGFRYSSYQTAFIGMQVFRGVDGANPIVGTSKSAQTGTDATSSGSVPSHTTAGDNSYVLRMTYADSGTFPSSTQFDPQLTYLTQNGRSAGGYARIYGGTFATSGTVVSGATGNIGTQSIATVNVELREDPSYIEPPAEDGVTTEFLYTGTEQTWVVPEGVHEVQVECFGAPGKSITLGASEGEGGYGGYTKTMLQVTPGETLYLYVGGTSTTYAGGWNGGGDGGSNVSYIGGGGGGTDVRRSSALADRIIVAGGGGGAGYSSGSFGGAGGGATALAGTSGYGGDSYGGKGATQSAGGAAGNSYSANVQATAGTYAQGGKGGTGTNQSGGGGGGGFYGGGGGGAVNTGYHAGYAGGGGGGSAYVTSTNTSATIMEADRWGFPYSGDGGKIAITYFNIAPSASNPIVSGTARAGKQAVTVSWTYNDPEGDPQTKYSLRWRKVS